ncbi:DUF4185 domain-containing protein [Nocardioides currus]|uniref:DUF4185 domain-containing protein n=1 Tax=Nocardioides currus TaxID=2133958 RepID=A0A2R7Z290_9ACTN|nr:DUF4185 domain-containing protein [Nocardioides currus]PUA82259.1 hypothetical protein C7S10_00410 [Nocardioides currus]
MLPRPVRACVVAVVVAVQVALLATLLLADRDELHDAQLGIVAPGLVGELVAQHETGAAPDLVQLVLVPLDRVDAERGVREGDLVGALVVDLAAGRDTLLVHGGRRDGIASAAQRQVEATERTLGRTVAVRDIAAPTEAGRDVDADRTALAALVLGFLLGAGAVLHQVRHPAGHRVRDAAALLLAGSPLIGLALAGLAPGGPFLARAAVLATAALAASLLPSALAAAASRTGMVVASAVGLCLAAPLAVHLDDLLLPQPWSTFFPWTAADAARTALSTLAAGDLDRRAVAVLAAWVAVGAAAAVSGVRRSARRRSERLPVLHTAAAAAPAAIVLLAAAALVPAGAEVRPDADGLATTSECVEVGQARSVRDLNAITRKVRGGGDVGASVELQDGRVLMMFGDTLREDESAGKLVRNSMLVFDDRCIRAVLPPDRGAVVPNRSSPAQSSEVGYWPMSVGAAAYDGYDLVAVLAQRVRSTGTGGFDFEALGSSVAVFVVPSGGVPQLVAVHDLDEDSTDPTRPMWGAASASADGWVYLYGTATTGEELVFGHSLRVARMRLTDIVDPRTWTYWDGSGWSRDTDDATELIAADGGTSQTLSVFEQDGLWFALSKRDEFLGDEVVVWPAPSPQGPFGPPVSVADLPSEVEAGVLRYMPLAHPGLLPKPGTVVVSYSNNRTDFDEVLADPSRYRPTFLRVRLP